ncbi:beta-galactosidase GalB [Reichenbachiella sp. 5M10]|uniref:beta-galactosidase GalB n=1 Tax=Reichenbachiella sp. 5M10 TaxID=1889772 RepID=UPI000C14B5BC|nr:beta-galactosidase GalB [Reichenbachiella sp. 5M10]
MTMKTTRQYLYLYPVLVSLVTTSLWSCQSSPQSPPRERISINDNWRFYKYENIEKTDNLIYDVRPEITDTNDDKQADSKPTEAVEVEATQETLKAWIMPTGNRFIKDPTKHYTRPKGNPGKDFPFVQSDFDDQNWQAVELPHDWAIEEPFYAGWDTPVGGGMGRLPSPGVAWYRRTLDISTADQGKSIFLDIDGAMSYAMVWINGQLAGGWPYGYSSWRLDLTPYLHYGGPNQLAIRIDNPAHSSRWYPGGGIYRNVWLVKTEPIHIAQWGTSIRTKDLSASQATILLDVTIDHDGNENQNIAIQTDIFVLNEDGSIGDKTVAAFAKKTISMTAQNSSTIQSTLTLDNPRLWGPPPTQSPNRYVAITTLTSEGQTIDEYRTPFGIRAISYDADKGFFVNGEKVYLKGVNQHHDLGALGAAFNARAAERQLEMLKELGCNAIRMAHNPPAPELLEMTDRMGFLVIDEMYDCWARKKTPHDFHLIFPEWHEQDLRALVRRDRNHPSIILWSTGNEVGEQYTGEEGAKIALRLREIVNEEDPTRPTSASMNYAKPGMPLPETMEVLNLNYQGEGIRNAPAYAHLKGINTSPLYPRFHQAFPDKIIISSENAAALSSRGTYLFPVNEGVSAPISDGLGGDPKTGYVSSYELYTADFGSSADKVFATIDQHPYVAGGFVWSGWDYLGEPTPYYLSRSSYFGLIDLAGFKKDRFYLYQSRWRPELPMAHILPHWNWSNRLGKITPVHVFTSGDEAELFLNGESLGRKKKGAYEYRLRWDDVLYEPGELKVIAYRDGKEWAEETIKTTDSPTQLTLTTDRQSILGDGKDLAFVTVAVTDQNGLTVPNAMNDITFSIEGPGEIIATDNGDPTSLVAFPSLERKAFNGVALAIVKPNKGQAGTITIKAVSSGLKNAEVTIEVIQ